MRVRQPLALAMKVKGGTTEGNVRLQCFDAGRPESRSAQRILRSLGMTVKDLSSEANLAAWAPRCENGAFKHLKQRRRLVRVYRLLLLGRHAVLSRLNGLVP